MDLSFSFPCFSPPLLFLFLSFPLFHFAAFLQLIFSPVSSTCLLISRSSLLLLSSLILINGQALSSPVGLHFTASEFHLNQTPPLSCLRHPSSHRPTSVISNLPPSLPLIPPPHPFPNPSRSSRPPSSPPLPSPSCLSSTSQETRCLVATLGMSLTHFPISP